MNYTRFDKEKRLAYLEGLLDGIYTFAWMKDGVMYVGTCGTRYKEYVKPYTEEKERLEKELEMEEQKVEDKTQKVMDFFRKVSRYKYEKFLEEEITAQPNNKEFLEGVMSSDFFAGVFERGFVEGIKWQKENKDTKIVV